MEAIMSESTRWKENRIRQEIYKEDLKHPKTAFSGVDYNGANIQGWIGTSVLLIEQTPGTRLDKWIPNRRKEHRLPWIIRRLALFATGLGISLWVYLGKFGIHRWCR
jgi:hypothetical protein